MENTPHSLIIIGSGPAGLTAAIYAARAELQPVVLEGETPGGQLMSTSFVENWPGNISILGPQLMMNIKKHAKHFGAQIIHEYVTRVDFSKKPFTLWTNKDKQYQAHSIILATGAGPKKLNCPGETQYWGKGVTTCAICDGALFKNEPVIVVGGGDTAMEDATFMSKFTDNITIVHLLDKFTASPAMQKRVLENPHIKPIYNSTITEIKGNGKQVTHAIITNQKTQEQTTIPTKAIFLAIGMNPNTKFLKDHIKLDAYGYIERGCHTTATSVPGIFACGDAADYHYRQAITSSGTGCMAALDAQRYLEEHD